MATLMRKKSGVLSTSLTLIALLCSASFAAVPSRDDVSKNGPVATTYKVSSVNWERDEEKHSLRIVGGTSPTYTMYELFEPLRLIIDIADASLESTVTLPLELSTGPVSFVSGKVLEDKEPYITRFELFLNEDRDYTVERIDNDIIVKFPLTPEERAEPAGISSTPSLPIETETGFTAETSTVEEQILVEDPLITSTATTVSAIEITHTADQTVVYLKADGAIKDYDKVELGKNASANRPDRIYIDLKNLKLAEPFETKPIGTALAQIRTAKREDGFRVVFDSGLDHLFDYDIAEREDGLVITIKEPSAATTVIANILAEDDSGGEPMVAPEPQIIAGEAEAGAAANDNKQGSPAETLLSDIEPVKPIVSSPAGKPGGATKAAIPEVPAVSDLSFAGYTKQRITVDFYKIDLHNVFRLFGEISNLNIVVDEGVGGSLTLALNDVPWDFALDIILNLKDLQKEERFNTIVISPKSKKFTWPERTLDSVEFKADIKIQQEEAEAGGGIKVSKRLEVPETVIEAKKLIHQAQVNERNGNYEAALPLYEEAFTKWSDNISLAKKIAAICLVRLEHNAKAIFYAKAALKINPNDQEAALQAAIALARMKRDEEAKEYFSLSTAGPKPPGEALLSYASYCEEKQNYDCSREMLQRNEDLYGDTLMTMVSKARVLDKQGHQDLAAEEYQAILLSGYEIPPDLARYINGRASLAGK